MGNEKGDRNGDGKGTGNRTKWEMGSITVQEGKGMGNGNSLSSIYILCGNNKQTRKNNIHHSGFVLKMSGS